MRQLITKYRAFTFEEKTIFATRFSIMFNAFMAFAKFFLAIFKGVFFFVAGVVNIFVMIAKLECYLGVKQKERKSFKYRNTMIGIFLMLSGIQYAIYMGRMIFSNTEIMQYSMSLGCCIAFVSFIEMGLAIRGCFQAFGRGHYYRNIKLINLCSALTALVLTEVSIMSFASEVDPRMANGLFGLTVGGLIVLIAIFIFIAPSVSIVDREHNIYRRVNDKKEDFSETEIDLQLTRSHFYGNYFYVGKKSETGIDGHIKKGKSPLRKYPVLVKILLIILSEILIFPYAFGALIFYFKNATLIKKLDEKMSIHGYEKIYEWEDAAC